MMPLALAFTALLLLATMAAGLARALRGPKPADRMVAVQMMSTSAVAMLLVLAEAADDDALRNVALAFVLLALMALLAFAERAPPGEGETDPSP